MFHDDAVSEDFGPLMRDESSGEAVAIPEALRPAFDAVRAARERYRHIAELLTDAERDRADAAARNTEAFCALAVDEAAVMLDGAAGNPALRKAALKGQEALLVHDARIDGLRARLADYRTAVDAALRELSTVAQAWTNVEIAAARADFWAAAEAFVRAAAGPIARGIGLGDPRLSNLARTVLIPDAEDAGRNVFQPIRGWKDSPKMVSTIRQLGEIRTEITNVLNETRLEMAATK